MKKWITREEGRSLQSRNYQLLQLRSTYLSNRLSCATSTDRSCQESLPISNHTPSFLSNATNRIAEPVVAAFIAGGVAGAVSRTLVSPLERLKILLQIQSAGRDEYRLSIWKALVKIGREEGWRGFMRGNGTNCIRIIPYSAVQFGSYNFYKRVSC